jgi:hypothetical protein
MRQTRRKRHHRGIGSAIRVDLVEKKNSAIELRKEAARVDLRNPET